MHHQKNNHQNHNQLSILEKIAENDKRVKVISFSRNFGHQCAVTAGLKYVTGDAIVIIDADLQDPPELIPEMLKLWENGNEVITSTTFLSTSLKSPVSLGISTSDKAFKVL